MITGKNYIGNALQADGLNVFTTYNPLANEFNDFKIYEASETEVIEAVSLASEAFEIYKNTSDTERALFLKTIALEIEALGEDLLQLYCKESGLPLGRAEGERNRTCFQLRSFAAAVESGEWVQPIIDQSQPDRKPLPKADIRKCMMPLGPVAVFGASNFPLAYSTAGGDTASALAVGCTVVVKSHPMHAATGEMVASAVISAVKKCNMPNGVFSNLNSSSIAVGQQLVKHPLIKAVGFTGSVTGGRALFDAAAQRPEPIPVFAEMGSTNPVLLMPKALENKYDYWAKTYASSITLGTGQFCTNPGLLIGIKSDALEQFIQRLSEEILTIEPSCMLHPAIHEKFKLGSDTNSNQEGTSVRAAYAEQTAPNFAKQTILEVSGEAFLNNTQLHQEVFGPFSMVVTCADEQQLIAILNNLEGQLTGT